MSELKSYDLVDIQDYRGEVYLKSEADKVIAHHKRKRCLAMALLCFTKGKEKQSVYKLRTFFWNRWGNRWWKLADEPTWAKFLQLIHKEAK